MEAAKKGREKERTTIGSVPTVPVIGVFAAYRLQREHVVKS